MTSTWHSLDAEAERVTSTTNQEASETCSLLKNAVSVLADGFTEAEVKGTDAACAQAGLLSQNLNSLKCSVDLSIRGYYTQSTGLLRGIYENWIAFHYLVEFPLKADLWLKKNRRPPGHSDMLNALGSNFIENKGDARKWYGTLAALHTPTHLSCYRISAAKMVSLAHSSARITSRNSFVHVPTQSRYSPVSFFGKYPI